VIPDAAFLLSVAGLNASFAGLGGLLVGLRRGPALQPLEALRLRQVVEFAFANLLLAVSVQPAVAVFGPDDGYRLSAGLTLAYLAVALLLLRQRVARVGISWGPWWAASAIGLTISGMTLAVITLARPSPALYELLMISMLARPMSALLLVLGTVDSERGEL
jgi:hypothetical protein